MKKILLIGSTGFIGKKLKIKLSKNFKLICPTKKQDFDITKKKELKKIMKRYSDNPLNVRLHQYQENKLL